MVNHTVLASKIEAVLEEYNKRQAETFEFQPVIYYTLLFR